MKGPVAEKRLFAALVAGALLARLALAVLTEFKQIFPDYYFNDAVLYDAVARKVLAAWASGDSQSFISPGMETFALWMAFLYKVFLPAPIVVKFFNAVFGAAACAVTAGLAASLGGRRAGLVALALCALWPSHVFYTSQAFREAPTLLFIVGALASFCAALSASRPKHRALLGGAGAACVVAAGFLRPHLVPFLALAGCAAPLALLARSGSRALPRALTVLAFVLAGTLLYKPLKVLAKPHMLGNKDAGAAFLPPAERPERPNERIVPYSPRGLTDYRRARQLGSRVWAQETSGRKIDSLVKSLPPQLAAAPAGGLAGSALPAPSWFEGTAQA